MFIDFWSLSHCPIRMFPDLSHYCIMLLLFLLIYVSLPLCVSFPSPFFPSAHPCFSSYISSYIHFYLLPNFLRLNTVRDVCTRCPLAMNVDLIQDLAGYKSYRDKSVVMAARSLIQLFKSVHPELLNRKDRVGKQCTCTISCRTSIVGLEIFRNIFAMN